MTKFCLSAQDIHYKNKALVGDEIDSHTLCEELMLNDSFHLYISRDSSQDFQVPSLELFFNSISHLVTKRISAIYDFEHWWGKSVQGLCSWLTLFVYSINCQWKNSKLLHSSSIFNICFGNLNVLFFCKIEEVWLITRVQIRMFSPRSV